MEATDYALLSFSPSSGIGVYARLGALHEFDLVTEEDAVLLDQGTVDLTIVMQFGSRDELLAFATTEYLRDKKHMYYSTLLTQDVDDELRDEMLEFLNSTELVAIAMAEQLIAMLQEIGSPSRAWRCARRAAWLGLAHVVACLRTHFQLLLGPPWILTNPAPPPHIFRSVPQELFHPSYLKAKQSYWVGLHESLAPRNPDTESYVRALIGGEPAIQEHFFAVFAERLQHRVPSFMAFMAEDLVMDALMRTLDLLKRGRLREPWNLRAFARGVLSHLVMDSYREEHLYVPLGKHLLTSVDQSIEALLEQSSPPIAKPAVPPEAAAAFNHALKQLQKRRPQAANVLELRLEGMTMLEIAEALGISSTDAERYSLFARTWLREYFRDHPPTRK